MRRYARMRRVARAMRVEMIAEAMLRALMHDSCLRYFSSPLPLASIFSRAQPLFARLAFHYIP